MVAANMVLLYGSTNNVDHLKRYARLEKYYLGDVLMEKFYLNNDNMSMEKYYLIDYK